MSTPVLSGITWDHPRGYAPLIAAAEVYEQKHGLQVHWEKRSLKDFGDQSLKQLAARFDLLIIDHPHVGIAVDSGCILPLDSLLSADQLGTLRSQSAGPGFDSYHYKGRQWALPVDAAVQCSAGREDLLTGQPFPHNWKEVFALADELDKQGIKLGMALCPTDSLCTFLSLTAQLGAAVKEGDKPLFDRQVSLEALALMRQMRDRFHPDSMHWNPIQLYDHMASEDDIAYAPLAFGYTNYARTGFRPKLLRYGNAPGTVGALLGGAGIAVSRRCKETEAAAQFAAWLCSSDVQSGLYLAAHGQPGNRLAWLAPHANQLTNNFFADTLPTLEQAYVRPRHAGWPDFQAYLGEMVHAHLISDSDPLRLLNLLKKS